MLRRLKREFRNLVRRTGVELTYYTFPAALRHIAPTTVLDVGANEGQFARGLRDAGYAGEIISFEPLSHAHARLRAAAAGDPLWRVPDRMALGAAAGVATIHIAANSHSSSLLAMADAHVRAAPYATYIAEETVNVWTLDSFTRSIELGRCLLKLDVQGYELEVLRGADATLAHVQAVFTEVSFDVLYHGGARFRDVLDYLEARGFALFHLAPSFYNRESGQMLQADAMFVRAHQSSEYVNPPTA